MSNAQRVIRNILSVLGSELLTRLTGFVLALYVVRKLGAGSLGQLAFLTSFMTLASVLSDLGISRLAARNLSRDPAAMAAFAPAALRLKLLLVGGLALLLALASPLLGLDPPLRRLFLVFIGWFVGDSLNLYLKGLFTAREALDRVGLMRAVEKGLFLVLLVAVILLPLEGRRLEAIVLLFPLTALAAFALGLVVARRDGVPLTGADDGPSWRDILARSWPFAGSIIMANVYIHSDRVILSYLRGDVDTGLYDAANRIFITLFALQALMAEVFFPTFSRLYAEDRELYRRFTRRAAGLLFGLALPLATGAFILAGPGMSLIFGAGFEAAVLSLRLLCPVLAIRAGLAVWGSLLQVADRERRYLLGISAGALLNLALNFALIPRYSLNGAAFATLLAEALVLLLFLAWARGLTRPIWLAPLLRALGASAGMALVLVLLPAPSLGLSLGVGAGVYALLFLLLGGLGAEDRALLIAVLSRRGPA